MRTSSRSVRPAAAVSPAQPTSTDPKRRRFLFTLGVSGAGAVAASVAAMPAAATPSASADDEPDAKYRETAHVRDYYRTTRI